MHYHILSVSDNIKKTTNMTLLEIIRNKEYFFPLTSQQTANWQIILHKTGKSTGRSVSEAILKD